MDLGGELDGVERGGKKIEGTEGAEGTEGRGGALRGMACGSGGVFLKIAALNADLHSSSFHLINYIQ